MQDLTIYINQVENKWLSELSNFCENLFHKSAISSHDHLHHRRVWEFSKEILFAVNKSFDINYSIIESCIIASMFHDTGLVLNIGPDHGKESRKICLEYFNNTNVSEPANFETILDAIETHDNKEYTESDKNPSSVLSILCNADDLDAFGHIGIIRYTEIYLLRGASINELPELIISNLDQRFKNFENTYISFSELYKKHKLRYLESRDFFERLRLEL